MKNMLQSVVNSRYFNIVIYLCMFLIPFIIYRDLYIQDMLLAGGDGYGTAANLIFFKDSLKQGEFPLWNKYLSNGVPFAGDISNHAFYIIGIIFSWLPDKLYLYTFYAFHISLGAFFTYLYLKEIGCGKLSSLCIGFIYLLSIQMGGMRKGHLMIITCIVYLPVILYFIEKYFKTNKIKWLIISSFAMAMQFYNAFIQDVMYTDIIVFIYLFVIGIHKRMSIKKMLYHGVIWICTYFGLIAMQLIPTYEMLKEYGKAGSSEMIYDIFASYSIHFIKLLQMLFPYIFGDNVYESFGAYKSSGLDIELFLGHFILLFVIFGIIKNFRDFRVRLSAFIMAGTFLFAAQTQIEPLSKLLFHIPIIRNMRAPSRILFVFIFFAYVICGITLSKLREQENIKSLYKLTTKFIAVVFLILITAIVSVLIIVGSSGFPGEQIAKIYDYFSKAFVKDSIFLLLIVTLIFLLYQASFRFTGSRYNHVLNIFCLSVMLITIVQTFPFTTQSSPASLGGLLPNDAASHKLVNDVGNYKIWEALPSGNSTSIISLNSGMSKGLSSINAYISINNPRIYRLFSQEYNAATNSSGLLIGSIKAIQNLKCQNDLLSMLGVKYIIDSSDFLQHDNSILDFKGVEEQILVENEIIVPNTNGQLYVYSKEIKVYPDTLYKVSFEGDFHGTEKDIYYVDFYAGESYDSLLQQAPLILTEDRKNYNAYIYSGESPDIVNVRFVGINYCGGTIHNFTVSEVEDEIIENVYIPYYSDESTKIYLNTNAKDVIYTPKTVESINSVEDIYTNVFNYSLDETSYIENFKNIDLTDTNTEISAIDFKNNSIRAEVSSSTDTFVNFSQNYYPGWKAYVNGKQVPIYMVNGLIQGIEVPAGDSTIEFIFRPASIFIGGAISLITLLTAMLIIIIERKKLQVAT